MNNHSSKMRILIAGPQGSGKTTQAKKLSEKLGYLFIATGDILREEAKHDTSEGRALKETMRQGGIANDEITAKLVASKIKDSNGNGLIMDGFPRRLSQLEYFDPGFDRVVYLEVPDEEVTGRLLSRGRADDKPEIISERLKLYHMLTEPVLDYYQRQGKLLRIDAKQDPDDSDEQSIEKVAEKIEKKIKDIPD